MAAGMVPDCHFRVRQMTGLENGGLRGNHDGGFTDAVSLPPHNPFFTLGRLVHRPVAGAAYVSSALSFASMSFGIAFVCTKAMVFEGVRQIDSGEPRCVLAAPFDVKFIIQAFPGEIAFFVGDPIIEPAVRLNNQFRHSAISSPSFNAMLKHDLACLQLTKPITPSSADTI